MQEYLNVEETNTLLESLATEYQDICELIRLPHVTHENRTSYALAIKVNPALCRHTILLVGGAHAAEWGSTDILMELCANYYYPIRLLPISCLGVKPIWQQISARLWTCLKFLSSL